MLQLTMLRYMLTTEAEAEAASTMVILYTDR